jgi:LPS sulfotransferase NodH
MMPEKPSMRGFEAEWAEMEDVRRTHADLLEKVRSAALSTHPTRKHILQEPAVRSMDPLVVDLVCLLDDAERLFEKRRDGAAYQRIEHVIASHRHPALSTMRALQVLVWELAPASVIENMLYAENDAHPEYRAEALARREALLARRWQEAFRAHGLDGTALAGTLHMKPGPAFGKILRAIQAHAKGEKEALPELSDDVREQVHRAVSAARATMAHV